MTQKILILNGEDIEIKNSRKHWEKLKQHSDVSIEFKNINDHIFSFGKKKYDLIIINAHGELLRTKKDGAEERQLHRIATSTSSTDPLRLTANHIKKYAQYTDTILLITCYGGAVMKDLHDYRALDNWRESLKSLKLIAPIGSKHTEISFDLCHLRLVTELLQLSNSGTKPQEELISLGRVCPDTICMRDTDGGIYKLTALKIPHSVVDGEESSCVRYFCKASSLYSSDSSQDVKFWERKSETSVFSEDISGEFGSAALCAAISKGKVSDAEYFLMKGVDVERSPSTTGFSPLSIAAKDGNLEMVKLLIEYGADPQPKDKLLIPVFLASQRGSWEVVDFLLDLLTLDQLNTNKDAFERFRKHNDPNIEGFLTRVNAKLSEFSEKTEAQPSRLVENPKVQTSKTQCTIC